MKPSQLRDQMDRLESIQYVLREILNELLESNGKEPYPLEVNDDKA